jgi:hypothetical protein
MGELNLGSSGSMGINQNFQCHIKSNIDSPKEVLALKKIQRAESQMNEMVDFLVKKDNTEADFLPAKGRVGVVQSEQNFDLPAILEYDTETKKPISLKFSDDKTMSGTAFWNKEGKMEYMLQERRLPDHVETVHLEHDRSNGIIHYTETFYTIDKNDPYLEPNFKQYPSPS